MGSFKSWWWRKRSLDWPLEREVAEELRFHLACRVDENLAAGMSEHDAQRDAEQRLGDFDSVLGEGVRVRSGGPGRPPLRPPLLDGVLTDLRYGVRLLRANPVVSVAAIASLAFGIGAATTFFTATNVIILRPLPYPDADRLVTIYEGNPEFWADHIPLAPAEYLDWKSQTQLFSDVAAARIRTRNLADGESAERLNIQSVSGSFMSLFGVDAMIGRVFMPEDDEPTSEPTVLLSYGYWQRRFGGDPNVLGTSLRLARTQELNHTVIGVLPPNTHLPKRAFWVGGSWGESGEVDAYLNLGSWLNPGKTVELTDRGNHMLLVIGRLAPGVPIERARQDMASIFRNIAEEHPHYPEGDFADAGDFDGDFDYEGATAAHHVVLEDLGEDLHGSFRIPLLLPLGAAGLLLLIACSNVAMLLLARSEARRSEFAVRAAMGASRSRLFRQILAEAMVLGVLGGGLGLLLAHWGVAAVIPAIPPGLLDTFNEAPAELGMPLEQMSLDWTALTFSVVLSFTTVVLFGLASAVSASRVDWGGSTKTGGFFSRGPAARPLRDLLTVGEIAIVFVLLVGGALMVNTMARFARIEIGMERNLLQLDFELPREKYYERTTPGPNDEPWFPLWAPRPSRELFFEELFARLDRMPEVESAATIRFSGLSNFTVRGWPDERQPEQVLPRPRNVIAYARGDYPRTTGRPLLAGSGPNVRRLPGDPSVVYVNRTFVDDYFGGENPVGSVLEFGDGDLATVVGVIPDSPWVDGITAEASPFILFLGTDDGDTVIQSWLLVRTSGSDPLGVADALRQAVWSIDPELPLSIKTVEQQIYGPLASQRFVMLVLTSFSVMALFITLLGVYGTIHMAVTRRTRELGIRIALGAKSENVIWSVTGRVLGLTVLGVAIGGGVALAATRVLESLLYGVTPADPVTYAGTIALLLVAATVASLIPALGATRIDPVEAIRAL